jgi:hypothetical protein
MIIDRSAVSLYIDVMITRNAQARSRAEAINPQLKRME